MNNAIGIEKLKSEFIREAKSAPKLFKDLAKVEQYIAESYKTRSFIELIQNADDAQSTKFGIHKFRDGFVVANNGRPFTIEDTEALCRSGSSNKYRGGNTIGYRGIGFKSVVNIAKRIFIFSDDFAFFFDKATTKELFPGISDVPLVRIPHLLDYEDRREFFDEANRVKRKFNYQTLFVFQGLNERVYLEEFSRFDRSCLLFLNNLRYVEFSFQDINRKFFMESSFANKQHIVKIKEGDNLDEWEILHSKEDSKNMVALKKFHDNIIPALPEESVIHSFTPTIEFSGAYLKINGDYSTDPSRKNIDMDEFSKKSFNEAVSVITDTTISILNGNIIKKGFFTPFINVKTESSSYFKSLLFKLLSNNLEHRKIVNPEGKKVIFSSLRLKPSWLNYEDYESLCYGNISSFSKDILLLYPEIMSFFEQVKVQKLLLQEVVEKINHSNLTVLGCAQIFTKIVKQYRYDLNQIKTMEIKGLKIFPVKDQFITAREVRSSKDLRKKFYQHLTSNIDLPDIKMFFNRLDIKLCEAERRDKTPQPPANVTPQGQLKNKQVERLSPQFKSKPNLKKWRSAEKNAEEYIKSFKYVLSVVDVSKANLGYDLEVLLENRKKAYIEVKSVDFFSKPFKLTNNEYSSAHNYADDYYIALVINSEPFQIMLIQNPIESLEFQKQCERWSWHCENYEHNLKEVNEIFKL